MNRNELIEFLRNPNSLTKEDLRALEEIVQNEPYFQSARMLLAKGSKKLKDDSLKTHLASAAIYATDRVLLKKYISGELLFLTKPPSDEPIKAPRKKRPSTRPVSDTPSDTKQSAKEGKEKAPSLKPAGKEKPVVPEIPSGSLDSILEELQHDMEALKNSRSKFAEIQKQIEEEDAVSEALDKATIISEEKDAKPDEPNVESSSSVESEQEAEQDDIDELVAQKISEITKNLQEKTPAEPPQDQEKTDTIDEDKVQEPEITESKEEPTKEPQKEKEEEKPKSEKTTGTKEIPKSEDDEIVRLSSPFGKFKDRDDKVEGADEEDAPTFRRSAPDPDMMKKFEAEMWGDSPAESESDPKSDSKASSKQTEKTTKEKKDSKPAPKTAKTTKSKSDSVSTKSATPKKSSPAKSGTRAPSSAKKKKPSSDKKSDDDDKGEQKKQETDLIDKFISENPSISRPEANNQTPGDLSDKSSSWNKELASEYLAEIYLHQGNKQRAIDIYNVLSLKFPEKKSYFADLISKIE